MGFEWLMNRYKCKDIDECKEFKGLCRGIHCSNTIGSFTCGCLHGYETVEFGCIDVDECNTEKICPENSFCQNFPGNYTCQCHDGYQGYFCTDIDECAIVSSCHANATCSNSDGNYKCSCGPGFHGDGQTCVIGHCDDRSCSLNAKCVSLTSDDCQCKAGFIMEDAGYYCQDVDECLLGHYCSQNSSCTNLEGSFTCSCNIGFFGDGKTCQEGSCTEDICSLNEECVLPSTLDCRCKDGFERNDSNICEDIDECLEEDSCDENAICMNDEGSYNCTCKTGFLGNGVSCSDLHECETGAHNCHARAKCTNSIGSFTCDCFDDFFDVFEDGTECSDDECADGRHNCHTNA